MSKVIDILRTSKAPFASFELVPPLKGSDVSRLYDSIEPLMEFAPPFINVTCHRDEVEYVPNDDGTFTRLTLAKRPGTVAIVAAVGDSAACHMWRSLALQGGERVAGPALLRHSERGGPARRCYPRAALLHSRG